MSIQLKEGTETFSSFLRLRPSRYTYIIEQQEFMLFKNTTRNHSKSRSLHKRKSLLYEHAMSNIVYTTEIHKQFLKMLQIAYC